MKLTNMGSTPLEALTQRAYQLAASPESPLSEREASVKRWRYCCTVAAGDPKSTGHNPNWRWPGRVLQTEWNRERQKTRKIRSMMMSD